MHEFPAAGLLCLHPPNTLTLCLLLKTQTQRKALCVVLSVQSIRQVSLAERDRHFSHSSMLECSFFCAAWFQTLFDLVVCCYTTGRCNFQCLIFYCCVTTRSSLLVMTTCTLTHAWEPAVSHLHTHSRLSLVNLSLSQGWKTKPELKKKSYKIFPFM